MNKYILEKYGYHYGNLDINIKADSRDKMSGRDTGHFGTGFYYTSDYPEGCEALCNEDRCYWEIDLSKYNLFIPKSNYEGHTLLSALGKINELTDTDILSYDIDEIRDDFKSIFVEQDNIVDIIMATDHLGHREAYRKWATGDYNLFDYIDVDRGTVRNKLIEVIKKYEVYSDYYDNPILDAFDDEDNRNNIGGVLNEYANDFIKFVLQTQREFNNTLSILSSILKFPITTIRRKAILAVDNQSQIDGKSTVFMKSLGYDGIDVSQLSKDSDGFCGLDDTHFGSVIYNIKPNTYKKMI